MCTGPIANVFYEWDYPMCLANGNGTSQCALGRGLSNVPWEWDQPMCPVNGANQYAL